MILPFKDAKRNVERESSMNSPNGHVTYCLLNNGIERGFVEEISDTELKFILNFTESISIEMDIQVKNNEIPRKYTGRPVDYFFEPKYEKMSKSFKICVDDDVIGRISIIHHYDEPEQRVAIIVCGEYPCHLDGFMMGIDEMLKKEG